MPSAQAVVKRGVGAGRTSVSQSWKVTGHFVRLDLRPRCPGRGHNREFFRKMARQAGFEPATLGFEGPVSDRLSIDGYHPRRLDGLDLANSRRFLPHSPFHRLTCDNRSPRRSRERGRPHPEPAMRSPCSLGRVPTSVTTSSASCASTCRDHGGAAHYRRPQRSRRDSA